MITSKQPDIKNLITKVREYLPEAKCSQVEQAFAYAHACHKGQARESGEPYIGHPFKIAIFLAGLRMDATTLSAALLHDVVEDCGVTYAELNRRFGPEVTKLVDGVTKLNRMDLTEQEKSPFIETENRLKAETLRKMLLAMADDVRVILIKLADRFHNMQTLKALPAKRRIAIAKETLETYSPLAHRLGMWDIKWQLEDMSLSFLEPVQYKEISKMLAARRTEREEFMSRITEKIRDELVKVGLQPQVFGRAKHIYSIYKKIKKYADLGKEMTDIYDLYAIRILVDTKSECYNAVGVVHNIWHPVPGQFDDYVANPKENMYQSIHTVVMAEGAVPLEVQIRTHEMHQLAEYGVAAHWRYKEGETTDLHFEKKMSWLRQLLEWQRETSGAEEFLESVKTDVFRDQVFVYTPKGDIIELPKGATSLDFAYRIHTELGHRCIASKVNGQLVPLEYEVKNGDTIRVLTSAIDRGPNPDWLNPNLGYIHSASARNKVRQWFRQQNRKTNIKLGRELIKRETQRMNVEFDDKELASLFDCRTIDEFLIQLGSGAITVNQVISRFAANQASPLNGPSIGYPLLNHESGITVIGVGDLTTRLANCCSPTPGNIIVGRVGRSQIVTIHTSNCLKLKSEGENERLIPVEWGQNRDLRSIRLEIQAWDRVGLLRDITSRLSEETVNIASVITNENPDGSATIFLTLQTTGLDQLSRLFSKLEAVRGVLSASRSTKDVSTETQE